MTHHATQEATQRYAGRFRGRAAAGHFREIHKLTVSSLGIGTYLGQPDDKTDANYTAAVVSAVENGINVMDSAINYRFQRSERNIGAAMVHDDDDVSAASLLVEILSRVSVNANVITVSG